MKTKATIVEVIVEMHDGLLQGRVEGHGWMPTPYGKTAAGLIENLKELIIDYTTHEGRNDAFWSKVNINAIQVEFRYDLEAFFEQHGYLKISSVAEEAGLNTSLVRQYASGVKAASVEQAKKIEHAIHRIGKELQSVSIYA